jgi:hypothetical protein
LANPGGLALERNMPAEWSSVLRSVSNDGSL